MRIINRIRKILQSNALFAEEKVKSSQYKSKLNSFIINTIRGFQNMFTSVGKASPYEAYEDTLKNSRESDKAHTEKVIFVEKKEFGKLFSERLIRNFSIFKRVRRSSLQAIYATRNGYRTCDYSEKKGFYNF